MKQRHENTVLFLCTGNYYRSRFAEVLFNSVAGKMGLTWKASSRGLALERGVNNVGPMEVSAVKALEARGLRAVAEFGRFPGSWPCQPSPAARRAIRRKGLRVRPRLIV